MRTPTTTCRVVCLCVFVAVGLAAPAGERCLAHVQAEPGPQAIRKRSRRLLLE